MDQEEKLIALYCSVDEFWNAFKQEWERHLLGNSRVKRGPAPVLSIPEMMTIVILFHQSHFRNFKAFYINHVSKYLLREFPKLISYSRFVNLMQGLFVPLFAYLLHHKGLITGISFIDSTKIQVCHNKRIPRNKVFKGSAKRGKTTAGWFYGFKLHLIINEVGEILAFLLTPGNVADVSVMEQLAHGISGKLFGDKGYISASISKKLLEKGLQLFTTMRKNMKNKLLTIRDKLLLRKRVVIETVNDQLKNITQLEHTRHRSIANFLVNVLASLVAYVHQPKKPRIKFNEFEYNLLMTNS